MILAMVSTFKDVQIWFLVCSVLPITAIPITYIMVRGVK